MIQQNARQTKVIKSFEGKALTPQEAEQVAREEVDVLRLVYTKDSVPALQDFIVTLTKHRTKTNCLPVMLDVSSFCQGLVIVKEPRELHFGERVVCSQKGGPKDLQVKTDAWDRLWAPDAKVFIGSGQ